MAYFLSTSIDLFRSEPDSLLPEFAGHVVIFDDEPLVRREFRLLRMVPGAVVGGDAGDEERESEEGFWGHPSVLCVLDIFTL